MIEVFKTNVADSMQAFALKELLLHHFPGSRINFDLDDCDNILRVEGNDFNPEQVMLLAKRNGVNCSLLE